MNKVKNIIIAISSLILFYALISPMLLANVVIEIKDAIIITSFVIIMSLVLVIMNIKETNKMEENLLVQHEQLKTLLENAPIVLYLKDTNGKILLANQALSELFKRPLREIIGKSSHELYINDHTEQDRWIIENRKTLRLEDKVEVETGEPIWYRITKAPVIGKNNKVERIIVFLKNIDIEKQIEERKNTYVATLTHDLKTPTNAQLRIIDLLLKDYFGKLNDKQKEIIEEVRKSCSYMSDLISNILTTYTSDCGNLKVNYETFDVNELAVAIAESIKKLAEEKKQTLTVINKDETESVMINADRFHIKRVILNLISNAIYHGYKNSEIKIELKSEKDKLYFKVINDGQYIQPEELAEIYEKFKSVETAKKHKSGTGLGLYLAKEIIVSHNGEVFAQSDEDGVCYFGFWIPKDRKISKTKN